MSFAAMGRLSAAPTKSSFTAKPADQLPTFLAEQAEHFGIPGMSIAVAAGTVNRNYCVGKASLNFNVPVEELTLFPIGSNGKLFTAIAVMQLSEQGRLKLSDSILTYVPDAPAAWSDRTLLHLLHHTSGLPDYLQANFDWTKPHTRAEVLKSAQDAPPRFAAGSAWSYCNMNYILLGYAIEKASGISYRDYITDHVLRRAGINRSRVDASTEIITNRAEGYLRTPTSLTHVLEMDNDAAGWADGGIAFCAADWGTWHRAIRASSLVSDESLRVLRSPARLTTGREAPYGGALFIEALGSAPYFWHTGGVPGFTSFTLDIPARDLQILVATNVSLDSSRPHRYLGQYIAESFAPGSTALSLAPLRDDDPRLTQRVQDLLLRGDKPVDLTLLAPEIRQQTDPAGKSAPIPSLAPDVKKVSLVETRKTREATFRRYRFEYADRLEHVSVGFTPASLIFWAFWL